MIDQRQKPPVYWPLVVLFIFITICSIIAGIIFYNYQKINILKENQLELSSISYLKIRQISQWRLERINNGRFLGENNLLVMKFSEYLKNPSNYKLHKEVLQTLKSLENNFDYKNVLLLDNKGNVIIAYPAKDTLVGEHLNKLLPEIIKQRKIVLTDLHKADKVSFVHLDMVVPLIERNQNDTTVLGLLAIRIDPEEILYPLLKSWPTSSKSAESILFRQEGDEIVYLNELRHIKNNVLTFKKPVSSTNLPAVMALNGSTGTTDGIDYRNVRVVAAMNKVPGTPWYLVTKIDREEVLATLT
jgi:hypothetical protein